MTGLQGMCSVIIYCADCGSGRHTYVKKSDTTTAGEKQPWENRRLSTYMIQPVKDIMNYLVEDGMKKGSMVFLTLFVGIVGRIWEGYTLIALHQPEVVSHELG